MRDSSLSKPSSRRPAKMSWLCSIADATHLKEEMKGAIIDSLTYAHTHGIDRDEITNWVWPDS